MIGVSIDRAAAKHPWFEKYFRNMVESSYRSGIVSETAIFLAASAAAGIFASFGSNVLWICSTVIMAAVWIQTSFNAGFMHRWTFAVIEMIYFFVPGIFILPENTDISAIYGLDRILNDISSYIWASPVKKLLPDAEPTIVMLIIMAVQFLIFVVGYRMRIALKKSAIYCKLRLEQIENNDF